VCEGPTGNQNEDGSHTHTAAMSTDPDLALALQASAGSVGMGTSTTVAPDAALLASMMDMGFERPACENALRQTRNNGLEQAGGWVGGPSFYECTRSRVLFLQEFVLTHHSSPYAFTHATCLNVSLSLHMLCFLSLTHTVNYLVEHMGDAMDVDESPAPAPAPVPVPVYRAPAPEAASAGPAMVDASTTAVVVPPSEVVPPCDPSEGAGCGGEKWYE
jgi:hypothetical protein